MLCGTRALLVLHLLLLDRFELRLLSILDSVLFVAYARLECILTTIELSFAANAPCSNKNWLISLIYLRHGACGRYLEKRLVNNACSK
jgi:hypothetical protein